MLKLIKKFATRYSKITTRYSLKEKKLIKHWTLMLPGAGCEYRKKNHQGCIMCGFDQSVTQLHHGFLLPDFCFQFLYWLAEQATQITEPAEIYLYNGGSFFNQKEIPRNFQKYFFNSISKNSFINRIMVESRCEYINEENISEAVALTNGKRLTVAIGLESQDDRIRNQIIRKGLSKKQFESTVQWIRNNRADVLAYIFLKPPGLSEEESFDDAIKSIQYALSIGVSEIEVSCAFVQPNTKMAKAYFSGQYRPPSLWTVIKVIEEVVKNNWPVSIGGFSDEPRPIAIPQNCQNCSPTIYESIESFRKIRILGHIPNCLCKKTPFLGSLAQ